jgi:hypothetical protein
MTNICMIFVNTALYLERILIYIKILNNILIANRCNFKCINVFECIHNIFIVFLIYFNVF